VNDRALPATNNRLLMTKAVLWFLVGVASVVALLRYLHGLGPATALTDLTPWGLWIGFDVLAGVALAAGGFVVAATVYIFGRDRYHAILRPAILTAFLGYLAVIVGLLVDLGRPWNIWRPIFHQNLHSPLFEVAMCVMLYTAVLALEFAPVGLERWGRAAPVARFLKRLTLPLVVAGIALSSLHQSSLGTLFLLAETRLHPLWYSPILPFLFLISAVALGLAMVTFESVVSGWLYRRRPEWPLLQGLTQAAAVVLGLYLGVRLLDLGVRGQLGWAFTGGWWSVLFWVELGMSAIVPILLFTWPGVRGRGWAIGWGAGLSVAGFILHRADVGGISHVAITGQRYVPALSELAISLGVVATMALIFLFFVERLHVWEERPAEADHFTPAARDPMTGVFLRGPWLGGGQRAALAWITGAVAGIVLMETQLAERSAPRPQPVSGPRTVQVLATERARAPGHDYLLADPQLALAAAATQVAAVPEGTAPTTISETTSPPTPAARNMLLLGREGGSDFVVFDHGAHQGRLGGPASCVQCHHRNLPLDGATSCARCHADMHRTTDTFSHASHVAAHGQEASCALCHQDPDAPKTRAGSRSCDSCHRPVAAALTRVHASEEQTPGLAPSYERAMHGLCIECHRAHEAKVGAAEPYLSRCANCHRPEFSGPSLRQHDLWPAAMTVQP
jgi:Ni/Fe-hydrogenase subunit HybB-like protein